MRWAQNRRQERGLQLTSEQNHLRLGVRRNIAGICCSYADRGVLLCTATLSRVLKSLPERAICLPHGSYLECSIYIAADVQDCKAPTPTLSASYIVKGYTLR